MCIPLSEGAQTPISSSHRIHPVSRGVAIEWADTKAASERAAAHKVAAEKATWHSSGASSFKQYPPVSTIVIAGYALLYWPINSHSDLQICFSALVCLTMSFSSLPLSLCLFQSVYLSTCLCLFLCLCLRLSTYSCLVPSSLVSTAFFLALSLFHSQSVVPLRIFPSFSFFLQFVSAII